jgi:hypothetical protein
VADAKGETFIVEYLGCPFWIEVVKKPWDVEQQ